MMNIMKAAASPRGAASAAKPANALAGGVKPAVQAAGGYNPGLKASGAPMPFSPVAQSTMTSAFGAPMENLYDRAMSTPQQPPIGVETPIVPPYDLT
jgi:hypothetical protein